MERRSDRFCSDADHGAHAVGYCDNRGEWCTRAVHAKKIEMTPAVRSAPSQSISSLYNNFLLSVADFWIFAGHLRAFHFIPSAQTLQILFKVPIKRSSFTCNLAERCGRQSPDYRFLPWAVRRRLQRSLATMGPATVLFWVQVSNLTMIHRTAVTITGILTFFVAVSPGQDLQLFVGSMRGEVRGW